MPEIVGVAEVENLSATYFAGQLVHWVADHVPFAGEAHATSAPSTTSVCGVGTASCLRELGLALAVAFARPRPRCVERRGKWVLRPRECVA